LFILILVSNVNEEVSAQKSKPTNYFNLLFSTSISKNTDIQITKYNLSTKLFFGIAEYRDGFYLTQRRKESTFSLRQKS